MKIQRALALAAIGLSGVLTPDVEAEQVSFNTRSSWLEWTLPTGAVDIGPTGKIIPAEVRKDINAVLDASDFDGGIRAVGSGARSAVVSWMATCLRAGSQTKAPLPMRGGSRSIWDVWSRPKKYAFTLPRTPLRWSFSPFDSPAANSFSLMR